MKYTKQLFVHRINSFVQFQTTPFLTYTFVSLRLVAYYGNYTIIVDKLVLLINTVLDSTSAGVGNLISEGNKNKIESVFWELMGVRFWAAGIIVFSLYLLMDNFIQFWLGDEYLLSKAILMLLLLKIYIQLTLSSLGQFIYGYGLFGDVWSSILQSIIFLLVAIVAGYYFGLEGIIGASIFSTFIIMGIWKPYYLYKKGFKSPVNRYWIKWFGFNLLVVISSIFSYLIINVITPFFNKYDIFQWLMYIVCVAVIYVFVSFFFFYIFTDSIKSLVRRFIYKRSF